MKRTIELYKSYVEEFHILQEQCSGDFEIMTTQRIIVDHAFSDLRILNGKKYIFGHIVVKVITNIANTNTNVSVINFTINGYFTRNEFHPIEDAMFIKEVETFGFELLLPIAKNMLFIMSGGAIVLPPPSSVN